MSMKILVSWCVKYIFRRRCHFNPVPDQPPVTNEVLGEAQTRGTGVLIPVGRWDECIVPMLNYVRRQTCCRGPHKCVKLVQHDFSAPPSDKPGCFSVDPGE